VLHFVILPLSDVLSRVLSFLVEQVVQELGIFFLLDEFLLELFEALAFERRGEGHLLCMVEEGVAAVVIFLGRQQVRRQGLKRWWFPPRTAGCWGSRCCCHVRKGVLLRVVLRGHEHYLRLGLFGFRLRSLLLLLHGDLLHVLPLHLLLLFVEFEQFLLQLVV
jgi:hypothetical protein